MTVHSYDRKSWLTKLDRISELSAQSKDIVFNNIGHLIDIEMLKEQYLQLDGKKAVGIDKITKAMYGENLDENLKCLLKRIRRNTYQPKPARITEIPKEDGSTRPLAVSCLEDKLVQLSVSTILTKIYEPLFFSSSFGYRPGKSCHDALRALSKASYKHHHGAIVEIDIRKYFNTIPHKVMLKLLRIKISDKRFLRLIRVLIMAPIREGKADKVNKRGCPQGSILSPILANIYLHYVIDEWFESIKRTHFKGNAEEVRFADDMVFSFERLDDAKRFYKVLPKRLAKAELEIHESKSQLLAAGSRVAKNAEIRGKRLKTFNFLGFTCYWGKSRKGFWRLKYTSRKDRFAAKLKGMKHYLRKNLNTPNTINTVKQVVRVVKGWINYHAVSDNQKRIGQFLERTKRIIWKWLNRRGGKSYFPWKKLPNILNATDFPTKWKIKSMF
jgi:group II intron reverse transcriptase/maturase